MNWQSIDTAPKDAVILTEEGLVIWSGRKTWNGRIGWAACDADGNLFRCVEEGPWEMTPKWWMPMPERPKTA